jgi:hypothetical protein
MIDASIDVSYNGGYSHGRHHIVVVCTMICRTMMMMMMMMESFVGVGMLPPEKPVQNE